VSASPDALRAIDTVARQLGELPTELCSSAVSSAGC
jgi:hypothetical protein